VTFLLDNALIAQSKFSIWFYKVLSFKENPLHTDNFLWSPSIIINILRISVCILCYIERSGSCESPGTCRFHALATFRIHWYAVIRASQDMWALCLMSCTTSRS